QHHPLVYRLPQKNFDDISNRPWVYFITPRIRAVFKTFTPLQSFSVPRHGAALTANFRFLRFWWEVGRVNVFWNCESHHSARQSSFTWIPYIKGGALTRWFGNYYSVVKWTRDGAEVKEVINEKRKK